MWIIAGALSAVLVVASVALLAVVARLLPPGRGRELAGFVPNCIVLLRRLRADRRLPRRARLALGVALGYVVSPVQLIPNIIPVIGQTDDLAVVMLALRYACRGLPRDEVRAAWPGNPDHLDRLLGRPASVRAVADGGFRPKPASRVGERKEASITTGRFLPVHLPPTAGAETRQIPQP